MLWLNKLEEVGVSVFPVQQTVQSNCFFEATETFHLVSLLVSKI